MLRHTNSRWVFSLSSSLDMHEILGCSLVLFLFLSMDEFVVVGVREPQLHFRVNIRQSW